ncbi:unnamed protein product [Adineta ricciae]|uniref:Transglutaminase-like domain-containing protein n=1 Tax=Adineta ricciae TaxID=249248 RepID=A0A815QN21_ADIRI|nr:unnamed protein product [Adineta ricciae]
MGCRICRDEKPIDIIKPYDKEPRSAHIIPEPDYKAPSDHSHSKPEPQIHQPTKDTPDDNTKEKLPSSAEKFIDIVPADLDAFNQIFIQQRQEAVNRTSYRSAIERWNPTSLSHLIDILKTFSEGKSIIDRHWFIFYWIASNIQYDTVSYFTKNYQDQTPEGVFRTRKGVCAGYANMYKYLCDHLKMPCEVVSGYSKGYGFDDQEGAPSEVNHAWNVVEIYNHWYLVESTWGAGYLNDKKEFVQRLEAYYFLARPNEMIYHHLPRKEEERWQLLEKPISMAQYLSMPKLRPLYFQLNMELISPCNLAHVDLLAERSYAVVLIKTPADVHLLAHLEMNGKKVEGGYQIIFDRLKQMHRCYFAPANVGKHKIVVLGKRGDDKNESYHSAMDLILDVKQMPAKCVSFPKIWETFTDLGLEIMSPQDTHLIKLVNGVAFAQILIKAPENVELLGKLTDETGKVLNSGAQVYFSREEKIWKCNFAPDQNGLFEAAIMAKEKNDTGSYWSAVSFKIDAKQIPSPNMSYPRTWKLFHNLGMKLVSPMGTHLINMNSGEKFTQIVIRTPSDVKLMGELVDSDGQSVTCGNRVYYDRQKDYWRCRFAPNKSGIFSASIFAKKTSDPGNFQSAILFKICANQIPLPPFSFPKTWQLYYDFNLKILSPVSRGIIVVTDDKPTVEVRLQGPADVALVGRLENDRKEVILRGHTIHYDSESDVWCCTFVPNRSGTFQGFICAKKKSDSGNFFAAASYIIDARQLSSAGNPLDTKQIFYDFKLEVIYPEGGSKIVLPDNRSFVEVRLKTPSDVVLMGSLTNDQNQKISGGHEVYYDRRHDIWCCRFAPNKNGLFHATILAKKTSDDSLFYEALAYHIEANHIAAPALSFPQTWQVFYDFDLKIKSPRSRATAIWCDDSPYSEVLIRAPDDVRMSCSIQYKHQKVENGALVQYDYERNVWQLLFAPERTGEHELMIYARNINSDDKKSKSVAMFPLHVTHLQQRIKFPTIYPEFLTYKCRIYSPLNGQLTRGSVVDFHCYLPEAVLATMTNNSRMLREENVVNCNFQRTLTVGSDEVTICAKYGRNPHYTVLIKYIVE